VDVQEVRKLDAYLKRLFGNPRIRVGAAAEEGRFGGSFISARNSSAYCSSTMKTTTRSFQFQMAILEDDLVEQG